MIEDVDVTFMHQAIKLAKKGRELNEVPVGAIVTFKGEIVGKGYNQCIHNQDPTAHAEIIAMRAAAKHIGNYRLNECNLYVTLEPCLMCFGACIHARIERLIFATEDPKSGVVINNLNLKEEEFFNHKISVSSGILAQESSELLKKFFQERRN